MDRRFLREFALAAACCRWPRTDEARAAVRAAAVEIDWPLFLRVVERHRIWGLTHEALAAAGVALPSALALALAQKTLAAVRRSRMLAGEAVALQDVLAAAAIPVVFFKGATLAQRAYGSLSPKHSNDIDLLIAPHAVGTAWDMLRARGYVCRDVPERLDDGRLDILVARDKELVFYRPADGCLVEVHWRIDDLPGERGWEAVQSVAVAGGHLCTLADDRLLEYLSVHGAAHAWARLKWLADFSALSSRFDADALARLRRDAARAGTDVCLSLALRLSADLLGATWLAPHVAADRGVRMRLLTATVRSAMTGSLKSIDDRPGCRIAIRLSRGLLNRSRAYRRVMRDLLLFNVRDMIECPLPRRLFFLYPLLRLPLWLRRYRREHRRAA